MMAKWRRIWKDTNRRDGKPGPWKRAWKRVPAPVLKPKYGVRGTVGPAVRFTWSEVDSGDGKREPKAYTTRVVKQAHLLNQLRKNISKHYSVSFGDVAINVNSWYRSPEYNAQIGGAKFSQHVEARATDIVVYVKGKRLHPRTVAQLAESVREFRNGGIGWYDAEHGNFTHVDHRSGAARWMNKG
jgi:hypothetical protein